MEKETGDWINDWTKQDNSGTPVTYGVDHGVSHNGVSMSRAWALAPGLEVPRYEDVHMAEDRESSDKRAEYLHMKACQDWNDEQCMKSARSILTGFILIQEKGTEAEKRVLQKLLKG